MEDGEDGQGLRISQPPLRSRSPWPRGTLRRSTPAQLLTKTPRRPGAVPRVHGHERRRCGASGAEHLATGAAHYLHGYLMKLTTLMEDTWYGHVYLHTCNGWNSYGPSTIG